MTPESSFKQSLKKRWDKLYKFSETSDWTALPGVKGIPDVHISIAGASGFVELKVAPNGLNKNQRVTIPKLSYGSTVFVLTLNKHPHNWREDTVDVVQWVNGDPIIIATLLPWEVISDSFFWEKLLNGNL